MFRTFKREKLLSRFVIACLSTAGLFGCASMGNPGGGLYDEDPPQLRKSDPSMGATNVTKQKITLHFDENVKLENAVERMTVSPPQEKMPMVMSNAKTVTIELFDSLKENTTYAIDLSNVVQDNNEGNPMESMVMLFSTGDHIDTMQISGHVLNAEDLEPVTGAYVGIYKMRDEAGQAVMKDSVTAESLGDSILMLHPFERSGKTDERGRFRILGCAPGTYKLYALIDGNTNYRYDLKSENIAFLDSMIVPSQRDIIVYDTLWIDSLTIDTIKARNAIEYLPNDLIVKTFNEGGVTRYLDDCTRPDSMRIDIKMAARCEEKPTLWFLTEDSTRLDGNECLVAEMNATYDTLSYWIKDSMLYAADTLKLELTYQYTDSTGTDIHRTDTIRLNKPVVFKATADNEKSDKSKRRKKGKDDQTAQPDSLNTTVFMTLKQLGNNNLNIGEKPRFELSEPVETLDLSQIHLEKQQDTLWIEMDKEWEADSLNPRRYTLTALPHFTPGESYRLTIDSAAIQSIYGHPLDQTKIPFKEKKSEEYAHLMFTISGLHGPAFVQLLNSKDQPVKQAEVKGGQAKFPHIAAGTYYARLVIDQNGNGKFDPGNLTERRQPEEVIYLAAALNLRANWEVNQTWDIGETPVLNQKPKEVTINKPKENKEKKSKNEEYLKKLRK